MSAKNCKLIDPEIKNKLKSMNDPDLMHYALHIHISTDSQELIFELASRLRQLPPYNIDKDKS